MTKDKQIADLDIKVKTLTESVEHHRVVEKNLRDRIGELGGQNQVVIEERNGLLRDLMDIRDDRDRLWFLVDALRTGQGI